MDADIFDWCLMTDDEPGTHSCDCDHCEHGGEPEPIEWLTLVRITAHGVQYISDRYILLRDDVAPIPPNYEGAVLGPSDNSHKGFINAAVTDQPAEGVLISRSARTLVNFTNWQLFHLADYEPTPGRTLTEVLAVVRDGEHVGWAMAANENVYGATPYRDGDA